MELPDSVRLKLNGTFERQLYLLDEKSCIYQVPYKVQTAVWFNEDSGKWQYISIFPDFIKRYCAPCLHLLEYISCQAGKGEDFYRHIDDPEAILDCEDSITRPARRIEKECMKVNYLALLNSRYMCIYNRSLPAVNPDCTKMFSVLYNLVLTARYLFGEMHGVLSLANSIILL